MGLTSKRKEELRKLHTDNRYGVLELLDEIKSLEDQLQWSLKNEEQYKNALSENRENLMQFQSEAQRMFEVENSKFIKAIEIQRHALKNLSDMPNKYFTDEERESEAVEALAEAQAILESK